MEGEPDVRRRVPQAVMAAKRAYLAIDVVTNCATSVVTARGSLSAERDPARCIRRAELSMRAILSRVAEKLAESRRERTHDT